MSVKRGDIYYADLSPVVGSEQGGLRPVLIIQNDVGNRYSPTVIAAAITSRMGKTRLPTHIDIYAEKAIKLNYKMYNAYEVLAAAYTYKGEKELAEKYFHTAILNGADKASLNDFVSRFEPDENSQDE